MARSVKSNASKSSSDNFFSCDPLRWNVLLSHMKYSSVNKKIIKKLQAIVGPGNVTTTREDLFCYSYDGTGMEYAPEAIVFPGSVKEIRAIMQLANKLCFPVIPRGAGTGMTGGAIPVLGGVVLAMSRFNRIIEIDGDNQVAVVEPGVITGDFQDELKTYKLFYPPDPASLKFCTIGGNVAECAGGPSAVKYGVTRDYVLGLEVVLPDGSVMRTGVRTAKGVVGYDLTRLFVGSEGTLGVITKITVRLLSLPAAKNTFMVLSRSLTHATAMVARLLNAGILPCTLEYMDRTALRVVNSFMPLRLAVGAEALLLIELDGDEQTVAIQSGMRLSFLRGDPELLEIRQAKSPEDVKSLWQARRSISPAVFAIKPHKISEDVVVPRTMIPELVSFVENMAKELNLVILTFGHAGDGNIHVNIMLDKKDAQESQQGLIAKKRLFDYVLKISGTISGEHGIGLTKADYLSLELDDTSLTVMRNIKKMFDPHNILNPAKMFPLKPRAAPGDAHARICGFICKEIE